MTNTVGEALVKASEKYSDQIVIRALMQAIPCVGGSLDTLFSGAGTKMQMRRIESFLEELKNQFDSMQCAPQYNEEEFLDLVVSAIDLAAKTRHKEKHNIYASIVYHHVNENIELEESEAALKLISELDPAHFRILHFANTAPINREAFSGLQVFTISRNGGEISKALSIPCIETALPQYSSHIVTSACSYLVARGLLLDEGTGRWGAGAMEIMAVSETARWLESWLVNSNP